MKIWEWVRFFVYITLGILVIVLSDLIFQELNYVVGGIMIFFGLESAFGILLHKQFNKHYSMYMNDLLVLLLGVIMLFLKEADDKVTVCVIWGTWSILREGWEISEHIFTKEYSLIISVINVIESIIVITLSIMMIFNPVEHHIYTHIYLLGIELILEVLFPLVNDGIEKIKSKKLGVNNE